MSIVPVHPLQLPANVPAYGQWGSHGNNRWGPTLDARGLGAGDIAILQPQRASVHGNTNTVIGIAEFRSTLVSTTNGYEGLGLYVSALKRDGETITRVWTNDLLTAGNTSHWINDSSNTWTRGHIVVQIPYQHAPDFIDTGWVVRGTSGSVQFDSVSLQDYFTQVYETNIGFQQWSTFQQQLVPGLFGGRDAYAHLNYLDTHQLRISKGQKVTLDVDFYVDYFASEFSFIGDPASSQPVPSLYGFIFKLLRTDGNYDWINPGLLQTTREEGGFQWHIDTNVGYATNRTFIAGSAYTQLEVISLIYPMYDSGTLQPKAFSFDIDSADITITVDALASSGTS